MLYSQAVDYIQNLEKFGSVYGLDTVRTLLDRLGNPQNKLKYVHIAGTNGKGSTSCFLTSILIKSGYKVGSFNSPSVFGYNERYLLDGVPIDDDAVAKYISIVAKERQKMIDEGLNAPTAFEVEFAVATLFFADNLCDIAVLECGLGGRLDATNVIPHKEVAIITSISFDHTAILGDTLAQIAGEKVAIVKDCPLVTYRQCDEVMNVFAKVEDLRICPQATGIASDIVGQTFEYKGKVYAMRQLGKYQLVNCSLAIESAEILMQKGYGKITRDTIYQGVATAKWKGRLEVVRKGEKIFLLDGAHNPDGARVLAQELIRTFPQEKCFVFGAFADKDVDGILAHIGILASEFITIKPPSKRGLSEDATLSKVIRYCNNSVACADIADAIAKAYRSPCKVVVICGSLSILDGALKAIKRL